MHVIILGAAGMIGRKLAAAIASTGTINGAGVEKLTLIDISSPSVPDGSGPVTEAIALDLSSQEAAARVAALKADVIFHLAAIVSGEAERDFEKGYAVNLDGTRNLFEAIRLEGQRKAHVPRLVFASSIAVYGAPFPDPIPEDYLLAPASSYGTQKAICELLLNDYTRRGFFDGIGIRLPTIVIRPGKPNAAASGFFSGILREPLAGQPAVLPVSDAVRHWLASPRAAVGFLLHAATLDGESVGPRRNLSMPGLATTVAEEIEALRRVAGDEAVELIRREPDPAIERLVEGWPEALEPERAEALGFRAETSVDELIAVYLADDRPDGEPV